MHALVDSLIAHVVFLRYIVGPIWGICQGRWFVFRNSPDWVVEAVASWDEDAADTEGIRTLIRQGKAEQRVRRGFCSDKEGGA